MISFFGSRKCKVLIRFHLLPSHCVHVQQRAYSVCLGLGLPVCLQNSTGLTFADSSILLEIGVGLGVDYVKLDAPGRPEIFSAAKKYRNIAVAHCNREPKSFLTTDKELLDSMPKIYSGFPVYTADPSASYVQEKREKHR